MLFFLLMGCGEEAPTETKNEGEAKNQNFRIGDHNIHLERPSGWENLPPNPETGVLWLMEKGRSNFVMMQRKGYQDGIEKEILASAMENFFFFRLEEKSGLESGWVYTARPHSDKTERVFYQKIIPIGQGEFLLGSCSFESQGQILSEDFEAKTDCLNMLNNWKVEPVES